MSYIPVLLGDYQTVVGLNNAGDTAARYLPPEAPHYVSSIFSPAGVQTLLQTDPGQDSTVYGINKANESVGVAIIDGVGQTVEWSADGSATVIAGLSAYASSAINNRGTVVGADLRNTGPVTWSPSTGLTALPLGPGEEELKFVAINATNEVLGTEFTAAGTQVADLWPSASVETHLAHVGGRFDDNIALGLNNNGYSIGEQIVYGPRGFGYHQGILWSPTGDATLLQGTRSHVYALNNSEDSVGTVVGPNNYEAARWDASGALTLLAAPASKVSGALDINDHGQAVGYIDGHAELWQPHGGVVDLANFLGSGWTHTKATFINNDSDIAGQGDYHGTAAAFLLRAI